MISCMARVAMMSATGVNAATSETPSRIRLEGDFVM